MSKDSSNKKDTPTPAELKSAEPKKWWHIFKLRSDWGIVMGVLISVLALLGPWFLLDPVFSAVIPHLQVSTNVKVAIITGAAMLVSLLIIAAALMAYNKKFRDLGLDKPKFLYFANAFVALFVYIAISMLLQIITKAIFGGSYDSNEAQDLGYSSLSGIEIATTFVCLVVLAPFTEEVIFRGFMYRGIRRHLPFVVTAIAVSALFGLVHGQWNVGLDVFAMSLISCYLVEKTGSLWPSIFLHVLKNGLAFSLVYLFANQI